MSVLDAAVVVSPGNKRTFCSIATNTQSEVQNCVVGKLSAAETALLVVTVKVKDITTDVCVCVCRSTLTYM